LRSTLILKDLNIRPETLRLLQERAGNTLEAISIGNDLLSRTQAAQQLREKINKWVKKPLHNQKKWFLN
jgi:hypothetical protein